MLSTLHIENIAVIERADIEFTPGFNVLTGETGAGKSIIIDSIDAVLGGRAARGLVRSGAEKAVINAVFTVGEAHQWCEENDIDTDDDELVLTRKLSAEGKGGCRVNGVAVSASQLRELGSLLLDIHGQNDGRQLMDESRHRDYLDRFGDTGAALSEFQKTYNEYRKVLAEIESLSMDDIEKERLTENLKYQIEELEEAELEPGEEAELMARREILRNSGILTENCDDAYEALYSADWAAVSSIGEALTSIRRLIDLSDDFREIEESLNDALFTVEDAAERIHDFRRGINYSPEEYDEIEYRLIELRRLSRKYNGDEQDMLNQLEKFKQRLSEIEFAGETLEKLRRELDQITRKTVEAANSLSELRKAAALRLQERIIMELRDLNMPSVRFEVEFVPVAGEPGFNLYGCDEIRFLMSANAGEVPGRISRIASGGELSRIMLAMKNVFAENDAAQTMIFDEIDSGVSGVAAQRVAEKIGLLSQHKQVLCVTHLPQIAAMADTHFVIEKSEKSGRTYTSIHALDRSGRAQELARLHGGDNITRNTLISAEEQLSAADEFKQALSHNQP